MKILCFHIILFLLLHSCTRMHTHVKWYINCFVFTDGCRFLLKIKKKININAFMGKIGQSSFHFKIKFILILAMFYEQTKAFIFFYSVYFVSYKFS